MTYISTKGMSRAEWLRARQRGIGGSDAAKIVLDREQYRYADPYEVYRSKVEPVKEEYSSLACRVGAALEPLAAELFTERTGKEVHRYNRLIISDERPFMVANIDRKLYGCNEGLECKTIGELAARIRVTDPDTGESTWSDRFTEGDMESSLRNKMEWYVQIQHYMAVTGWAMWHLAVLIGNRTFMVFDVPRDEPFIEELIRREAEFWSLVEKRENIWEE